MIAFVGDQLGRVRRRRRSVDCGQIGCGGLQRLRQGRGVTLIGRMNLRRDNGRGIEVDRMLGLVGQPGAAVLQLGDLGLRVGR